MRNRFWARIPEYFRRVAAPVPLDGSKYGDLIPQTQSNSVIAVCPGNCSPNSPLKNQKLKKSSPLALGA